VPVLRGRRTNTSFGPRLAATRSIAGYSEIDESRVLLTRDIVLPRARAIAEAACRQLLANAETARYFDGPDGARDRSATAARIDSMAGWIVGLLGAPLDEDSADRLATIGRAHTRRGGDPGLRVRARYLVALMGFLQGSIAGVLAQELDDPADLAATIGAWNKLLIVHLDSFLAAYGSAEGTAHWY
jgi:hypothetical protein